MSSDQSTAAPWASARFKRFAFFLSLGCVVAAIGVPIVTARVWFVMPAPELFLQILRRAPVDPETLAAWFDWPARASGFVLTMIPGGFSIAALLYARRCLSLFAGGVRFDRRVVGALRGFSGMTALSTVAGLIIHAPVTALLTFYRGPGNREIALGIGSDQIYQLFFAATVWLIATVMAEAVEIARENSEFV